MGPSIRHSGGSGNPGRHCEAVRRRSLVPAGLRRAARHGRDRSRHSARLWCRPLSVWAPQRVRCL